jgi:hypothetical protein
VTGLDIVRMVVGAVALAMVPVLWMLGIDGLPSRETVMASKTADIAGVWVFTWGLIWAGSLAAVAITWVCWSEIHAKSRAAADHGAA